MDSVSVAIVGGGPAGCAAAISAARALHGATADIVVYEAGCSGTQKPCAGGLTPESMECLRSYAIDENSVRSAGGCSCQRIRVLRDHGCSTEHDIGPSPVWVVPRATLDETLRQVTRRYCRIAHQSNVVSVERYGTRWRVGIHASGGHHELDFDAVILAHGSVGQLSRDKGLDGAAINALGAIQYSSNHRLGDTLYLDFRESLQPGYVWWFPLGSKGANWGGCVLAQNRAPALRPILSRMRRLSRHEGYSKPILAPEQIWSGRGMRWHHDHGMLSAGDAAGLADPYSGEGISPALVSGARAGASVASFLGGSTTALRDYSAWVQSWFETAYSAHQERATFWASLSKF